LGAQLSSEGNAARDPKLRETGSIALHCLDEHDDDDDDDDDDSTSTFFILIYDTRLKSLILR
jgi:hypothetical protein